MTEPSASSGRWPSVAIVVVNWNTKDLLRACLESLRRHPATGGQEVWVVDNASTDGSAEAVASDFPEVRLIRNEENLGFSRANNQALARAKGDVYVLLNSDAEVTDGALDAAAVRADAGGEVIAAQLLNPDGSVQPSCFRFPGVVSDLIEAVYLHRLLPPALRGRLLLGGYWSHDRERIVDWAVGAFLAIPRAALAEAGPLPEEYFIFGEDMEWCWRFHQAGVPVRYLPNAKVIHHANRSAGQRSPAWRIRLTHAGLERFLTEHHSRLGRSLVRASRTLGYRIRAALLPRIGRAEEGRRYQRILGALAEDQPGEKP